LEVTGSFAVYRVVVIGLTALAVLAPLSLVFYQSLLTGPIFEPAAPLSTSAYNAAFADPDFWKAFGTTMLVAGGTTAIALPLGALFAVWIVRTDLPGRTWLEPLIIAPAFVSTLIIAFGYVVVLGPTGFASTAVKSLLGSVPWNLHSLSALIVIAGLIHVPYVYLCAAAALRGRGGELEETARVAGAKPWRVAIDVSLPLLLPAILFAGALVFFLGFEMFGLPLVLGDPQGHLVLTTYLYKLTGKLGVPPHQLVAVVVVVMVAVAAPLLLLQRLLLRQAQRNVSAGGERSEHTAAPLRLGRWRWPAFLVIAVWLGVTVVVPLASIALRSFTASWGEGAVLSELLTLDHYRKLLDRPDLVRGMFDTLGLGVIGGAIAVVCYTAIALAIHRWPSRRARVVDDLVMLPRALPGLAAGLALVWLCLAARPLTPLKETLVAVWLAYTIVWLAVGTRLVSAALMRVAPELEEAARTIGADERRVRRDVTVPLIRHGLLASWLIVFLIFVREYSAGVYLLGPKTEMIGSLLVSLWDTGAVDLVSVLSVVNVVMIGIGLALAVRFGVRLNG